MGNCILCGKKDVIENCQTLTNEKSFFDISDSDRIPNNLFRTYGMRWANNEWKFYISR